MTPEELLRAWPSGVPSVCRFELTLAPEVTEHEMMRELITTRMEIIADVVTRGMRVVRPDFKVSVGPKENPHRDQLIFDVALSEPATDAMTYLFNGITSIDLDAGGGMFADINILHFDSARFSRDTILPFVAGATVVAPDRRTPASEETGALFVALPADTSVDLEAASKAMEALSAMVEEGCFGPSESEDDLSDPFVGGSEDDQEIHIGVTGYRGDPELARALLAMVAHTIGAFVPPLVILDADDSLL